MGRFQVTGFRLLDSGLSCIQALRNQVTNIKPKQSAGNCPERTGLRFLSLFNPGRRCAVSDKLDSIGAQGNKKTGLKLLSLRIKIKQLWMSNQPSTPL